MRFSIEIQWEIDQLYFLFLELHFRWGLLKNTSAEEIDLAKLEKFVNTHQNTVLVVSASLPEPVEWKQMLRIQQIPE